MLYLKTSFTYSAETVLENLLWGHADIWNIPHHHHHEENHSYAAFHGSKATRDQSHLSLQESDHKQLQQYFFCPKRIDR